MNTKILFAPAAEVETELLTVFAVDVAESAPALTLLDKRPSGARTTAWLFPCLTGGGHVS